LALSALPLSDSFPLVWEHDPALDRSRENFDHEYQISVDTLDWDRLCVEGQKPTLFHFRPMRDAVQRALLDMGVGNMTGLALVFRACLVRVENFPGCPAVKRQRDSAYPLLGDLATDEIIEFLRPLPIAANQPSGSIVTSLGALVLNRCLGISPKS
jgi:hypothetical protein